MVSNTINNGSVVFCKQRHIFSDHYIVCINMESSNAVVLQRDNREIYHVLSYRFMFT